MSNLRNKEIINEYDNVNMNDNINLNDDFINFDRIYDTFKNIQIKIRNSNNNLKLFSTRYFNC